MKRYRRKRRKLRCRRVAALLACALLCAGAWALFEAAVAPLLRVYAGNEAVRAATAAVEEAVEEALEESAAEEETLVQMERGSAGEVLAVTADMASANRLKVAVTQAVQEKLGNRHVETGIPLGTLLGGSLLHGRGPEVPLLVTLAGNVETDLEGSLESAGINQARHVLTLRVRAEVNAFLPGAHTQVEVETGVPVAETVLMGPVPETYARLALEDRSS